MMTEFNIFDRLRIGDIHSAVAEIQKHIEIAQTALLNLGRENLKMHDALVEIAAKTDVESDECATIARLTLKEIADGGSVKT